MITWGTHHKMSCNNYNGVIQISQTEMQELLNICL